MPYNLITGRCTNILQRMIHAATRTRVHKAQKLLLRGHHLLLRHLTRHTLQDGTGIVDCSRMTTEASSVRKGCVNALTTPAIRATSLHSKGVTPTCFNNMARASNECRNSESSIKTFMRDISHRQCRRRRFKEREGHMDEVV